MNNGIFIAATGQNVGKTTLCLGLLAGLKKRFSNIGFIKPVGQQHITFDNGVMVDKDVVLFHEVFSLQDSWQDMSPVIIPQGFTRDYLDEKFDSAPMKEKIRTAYTNIQRGREYTIVEGTGHVGVGSIVGLNNAIVAKELGLDMVILATGGLGSSFDDLALNFELCRSMGVTIRGVILNRVLPEKKEMIEDYFPKALKRWGVPLIGTIPFDRYLSTPTMDDFSFLFKTPFLSGEKNRLRHFQNRRLVASSLGAYIEEKIPDELIITPASREDVIEEVLSSERTGMILTGNQPPSAAIAEKIKGSDVPVLYAPVCSYEAMKKITTFIAKIRKEDTLKVKKAIELVENNIEFNLLCQSQKL